ncbi:MAG: transcription-repair coupling factor [Armatimonadetes bacterium]|nr:transcription-repair coupling factor [Armatimonadota bacterium]
MHTLLAVLERSDEFQTILAGLAAHGDRLCIEGASGAGKSLLIAGTVRHSQGPALVIAHNEEHATRLFDDLTALFEDDPSVPVLRYPSITETLYDGMPADRTTLGDRLAALERLAQGSRTIVVAGVSAVMHLTVPVEVVLAGLREVRVGATIQRDALARDLARLGYERADLVNAVGQFSVRGDIVDLFPSGAEMPVRIELFGDEVEALRAFDPASQRSMSSLDNLTFGPAAELVPDARTLDAGMTRIENALHAEVRKLRERERYEEARRLEEGVRNDLERLSTAAHAAGLEHYIPFFYDRLASVLDYVPQDGVVFVDEPVRAQSAADRLHTDVEREYSRGLRTGAHLRLPETACLSAAQLVERLADGMGTPCRVVYLTLMQREVPWAPSTPVVPFHTPPVESFAGHFDLLAEGLTRWQQAQQSIVLSSSGPEQTIAALRGRHLLNVHPLNGEDAPGLAPGRVSVCALRLSGGFKLPSADLVVLTENELYGWQKIRRGRSKKFRPGFSITTLTDLEVGDFVVHISHGIARYTGTCKQTVGGIEREYLTLQYAGEDRIYVPVTQMDRIQKYVGGDGKEPTVHALQSARWNQTKKRVRHSAALLARELLKLYRAREQGQGCAFSPDSPWLAEMEAAFRFEETPDQYMAVQDLKRDMEKPIPADRLICGDVGFGKTEVAIRGAFKAVLDGKQVAVLVPTTVLAQQHLNTFRERLGPYPVAVEVLSRFRSSAEQQKVVEGLKHGTVDIIIGTHRLLNTDVNFRDLGLVVIDEEQRFGVRQKERLKQLRTTVDVITLTATPIPRTMHMALSSIRDISVINDPPAGRLPIRTAVQEYDDEVVRQAILRELERGGQVYYVHNRVRSIKHVAAHVQQLVPQARIAVGHGQLDEDQLEHVMMAFYAHEFDVLVCTTIIESGLDIPNVNTIIVDDANRLGLAQLYQLRGRVGRSDRQAYAYLLYRYPDRMTPAAEARLEALAEFTDLGSGFKIAMRDLEIRGAGNLLGPEQSGHLEAVGLEMFLTMLGEAVRTLKGEDLTPVEEEPTVDLPIEAVIPGAYVPDERQRISLYRRLAGVKSEEELEALNEEIRDRFGPPPQAVQNLVRLVKLKLACRAAGIESVAPQAGKVVVRLRKSHKLSARERQQLERIYRPSGLLRSDKGERKLPRATFEAMEITFAYDPAAPERTLAAMDEVVFVLTNREPRAVGRERPAPRPRTPAAVAR